MNLQSLRGLSPNWLTEAGDSTWDILHTKKCSSLTVTGPWFIKDEITLYRQHILHNTAHKCKTYHQAQKHVMLSPQKQQLTWPKTGEGEDPVTVAGVKADLCLSCPALGTVREGWVAQASQLSVSCLSLVLAGHLKKKGTNITILPVVLSRIIKGVLNPKETVRWTEVCPVVGSGTWIWRERWCQGCCGGFTHWNFRGSCSINSWLYRVWSFTFRNSFRIVCRKPSSFPFQFTPKPSRFSSLALIHLYAQITV